MVGEKREVASIEATDARPVPNGAGRNGRYKTDSCRLPTRLGRIMPHARVVESEVVGGECVTSQTHATHVLGNNSRR